MKAKFFIVVLAAVVAVGFIGLSVSESADVGNVIKEQKEKLTGTGGTQASAGGFDVKFKEQEKLIEKSTAAKSISKEEAKTLQENLNGIRQYEKKALKDGKLGEIEKGNIQNMLDRNNKMITDKKNNPVKAFSRPEVSYRISVQQQRIDAGIKEGSLTKAEAKTLEDNLANVKAKYEKMKKDGKLTRDEEDKLHEILDKDSQKIYEKKHN